MIGASPRAASLRFAAQRNTSLRNAAHFQKEAECPMSTDGWLPPGVSDADIDRAAQGPDLWPCKWNENGFCETCGAGPNDGCEFPDDPDDDIWDASEHVWPRATQCACNPGCLSCAPSCGRS